MQACTFFDGAYSNRRFDSKSILCVSGPTCILVPRGYETISGMPGEGIFSMVRVKIEIVKHIENAMFMMLDMHFEVPYSP